MRRYLMYTDGSHIKSKANGRLGIGSVLVSVEDNQVVGSMSTEIDRDYMSREYGYNDVSNPTMELLAVLLSLKNYSYLLKKGDRVTVYADFMGVTNWMKGKWRINKPYIRLIKDDIDELVESLGIETDYFWVRGHSGNSFNSMADKLAKGE